MPCYRCGTRQVDPEPGKGTRWRQGVVREHQVLICPACQQAALADLARCPGCHGTRLIRRLDQVECLDCRLTRDADADPAALAADTRAADTGVADTGAAGTGAGADAGGEGDPPAGGLSAEVARAVARVLGRP
jgi:hypothetical protein